MTAPVCALQPDLTINQPDAHQWPAIPPATDLASALAAINAMRMIFQNMLNQNAVNNKNGGLGGFNTKGQKQTAPRYTEVQRQTQKVRVYNPNDKTQYVDVEQIMAITMKDSKTGEIWSWKR